MLRLVQKAEQLSPSFLSNIRKVVLPFGRKKGHLFRPQQYEFSAIKYSFECGSHILPHPQKQYKGGEDAIYCSKQVIVVADGVGGWADSGVDPALYSKELVKKIQFLLQNGMKDQKNKEKPQDATGDTNKTHQQEVSPLQRYVADPQSLLEHAVSLNKQKGSTTVTILTLDPISGLIRSYYLGDSVFAYIKPKSRAIMAVPDQQIQFNFPYQVGTNGHSPREGIYSEFTEEDLQKADPGSNAVKEEGLFVIATDGLWDNLHLEDIFTLSTTEKSLDERAKDLTTLTRQKYLQTEPYESPFHKKAREAGLRYPKQGKMDDTSVVVARVIKQQ